MYKTHSKSSGKNKYKNYKNYLKELRIEERNKIKKILRISLVIFSALILLTIIIGTINNKMFSKSDFYLPLVPEDVLKVEIEEGSSTDLIADMLKSKGIIDNKLLFKFVSSKKGYDNKFQPGLHYIKKGLSYEDMMKVLTKKSFITRKEFTIPEGSTVIEIIDILGRKEEFSFDNIKKAMDINNYEYNFLKKIDRSSLINKKYQLEGYLYPGSYKISKNDTEEDVIRMLLSEFDKAIKPEYYQRAEQLGMTFDQIITLASIIEKESILKEDAKMVSSVLHNRLSTNLKLLQVDSSVQYILINKDGRYKDKLINVDTQIDDLYNTYKNKGLPPGPICSPSIESIEAALYPNQTNYYYYALNDDNSGKHTFFNSYDEFLTIKERQEEENNTNN